MGITIRPAAAADLPRIAEIERRSFSDPWSAASFRSLLDEPHGWFAVAVDDDGERGGEVLGYAVAWFVVDEGEIANLAVAPAARRRHIGAALLDAAIAAGAAQGAETIFLEVRESNAAARTLYASRGFAEIGRRRGYYRRPVEDAVVMRLELRPA